MVKRLTYDCRPNAIVPELIVHDEELGLAGTIDLVVETPDGLVLIDWKTNKKITTKGYNNKKALEPIEDLDDCHLVKYSLQLSLYAYMLERQGWKIDMLLLVHLIDGLAVSIEVPYVKERVEELLEWQKNKQKK